MSLATTCPACATAFRVTPEQLSAHRGDVRCGQCQHVFNALNHLKEVPQLLEPEFDPNLELDFEATVIQPAVQETKPAVAEEIPDMAEPEPQPEQVHEAPGLGAEDLDFGIASPAKDVIDTTAPLPPADVSPEQETAAALEAIIALKPSPQAAEFLADKPKRGMPKWLLALFALLLLLGAAGQTIYFLRTEIAASFPPAKPWLDQGCLRLGCTVGLPRHVDMFAIEDSDLKDDAEHDGVMVLTYVLFNRAPYPQAYPLLELTLTDTFDKPVLRHTFMPQEYLPAGTDIEAGIGASSETNSRLHLTVSGDKPAGYRLWVKY
jgi:predicted Zn finger-like uncharacterized protein